MKLVSMEGEIWWFIRPDDLRPIRGLTVHQLVAKIQAAFHFISVPTTLPAEGQPYLFREGMFAHGEQTISIKFLEAYNDGTHVKVDSSTEDADVVFQELRKLIVELGGKSNIVPLLTYHVSTIVAEFSNNIDQSLKNFSRVSDLISTHLDIPTRVGLKGLVFGADRPPLSPLLAKVNPTTFRLETRVDAALEEKRYFSTAHMSTSNHVEVLTALDSMFESL
jgi:hypothetical protein